MWYKHLGRIYYSTRKHWHRNYSKVKKKKLPQSFHVKEMNMPLGKGNILNCISHDSKILQCKKSVIFYFYIDINMPANLSI